MSNINKKAGKLPKAIALVREFGYDVVPVDPDEGSIVGPERLSQPVYGMYDYEPEQTTDELVQALTEAVSALSKEQSRAMGILNQLNDKVDEIVQAFNNGYYPSPIGEDTVIVREPKVDVNVTAEALAEALAVAIGKKPAGKKS